ncbi:transferrin receptor ectodomain, apical domain-containing protein [Hesseltinella vesiculosa]|uniref:Transferrin receptor ectodomain, apical domain-containing protein n=1 Tax=Hesseltinella vesiculosa TaxID=101127 RepID=A0A1X2GBL0_9FUNG|nr:transferrin receptor ectodomain, apical domain-containing protein [Hesseltinella vesiculosa]
MTVGVDHSLNESQIFATTMDAIEPFVVKGQIDLMLVKEGWRPRPWQTWIEEQTTQPVVLDDWKNNVAIRMQGRHESRSLRASLSQFGPPFPLADDKVVLAPSQLAYFLESQGDQRFYGCDGYSEADKARIQGKILLVSRGECTFTRKMWWAQKAGAKAVLFVNNLANAGPFQARTLNKDEDWSLFALKQPSFFHEDTAIPHRHSVTIPSATLTREAGVALLDFLNLNDQVAIHVIQQPPLLMNDPSKWLGVKVHGVKVHNWVVLKV